MAFGYGNGLLAASAKGSRNWASSTRLSPVQGAVGGSSQPVRQHLNLTQVFAAYSLRGVLPGLVVPAPVLLLLRVDPVTLQQMRFRPNQSGDGD